MSNVIDDILKDLNINLGIKKIYLTQINDNNYVLNKKYLIVIDDNSIFKKKKNFREQIIGLFSV